MSVPSLDLKASQNSKYQEATFHLEENPVSSFLSDLTFYPSP